MRLVTKGLNRNERLIIILYYYEELTMKEIGATLERTPAAVRQLVKRAREHVRGREPRHPVDASTQLLANLGDDYAALIAESVRARRQAAVDAEGWLAGREGTAS